MCVSPNELAAYVGVEKEGNGLGIGGAGNGEVKTSMFSSNFFFNPRRPKMRSHIGAK
jgi:hypothetical protein